MFYYAFEENISFLPRAYIFSLCQKFSQFILHGLSRRLIDDQLLVYVGHLLLARAQGKSQLGVFLHGEGVALLQSVVLILLVNCDAGRGPKKSKGQTAGVVFVEKLPVKNQTTKRRMKSSLQILNGKKLETFML